MTQLQGYESMKSKYKIVDISPNLHISSKRHVKKEMSSNTILNNDVASSL